MIRRVKIEPIPPFLNRPAWSGAVVRLKAVQIRETVM
jgi:hypothetical protein